ncbi:glycosyltransferase family 9 protein [Sphingomonas sp. BIUV-7]|uniref:Glycosyltransferase family 9 protein n=1 Tax=Sphingomonas natans TaxID=3063330 RepID=A0ABT8Y5R2_9SPHN|nr:glycosyltransferase family 9 protein [Sphingomonas sp. BIUV-7]MDO6413663.1 glycosyltransferase family 9 protein [Sphingomonas sp. BIUV-7]
MFFDRLRSSRFRSRTIVKHLIQQGDKAREERRFAEAATFYAEAARLMPQRAGLHVQHGHMLKEAGFLERAERAYSTALRLLPDDADLALQIGHFYKVSGRLDEAARSYERALALQPGWLAAERELQELQFARGPQDAQGTDRAANDSLALPVDLFGSADTLTSDQIARLIPELAPRQAAALLQDYPEGLQIKRLGRSERSFWGNTRVLRGVEAVRGFCISPRPVTEIQVLFNGLSAYRGPLRGGYELYHARDTNRSLKYVFNAWIDVSGMVPGRYTATIRCIDIEHEIYSFEEAVVIAPSPFEENSGSDAEVPVREPDPVSLERKIRALPSIVRPAERSLFSERPKNVLLMRTDQLGDIISSTPAVKRLRELMPSARFVCLMTAANADLARTLDLFDEIIVIDFPDDKVERRRLMPLVEQEALRERLEPYAFDLAIDLSQSDVSRPLLLLSGAKFLYGVGGGDWPWLTAEFGLNTHDQRNRLDRVPHSAKTLALVETLGALLRDSFEVVRREDLDRSRVDRFGIGGNDRYAVLHMGARIEFSRWPRYAELAVRLLDETDATIVMMTEDPSAREGLSQRLLDDARFILLDERLSFDDFDALVSHAAVLVGNDSGPKHLASFRGVPAVTLFTARINWKEWGQERGGVIISRRVPCAGCALFHDPEECGQDFSCIRDISVSEVFDATVRAGGLDARNA